MEDGPFRVLENPWKLRIRPREHTFLDTPMGCPVYPRLDDPHHPRGRIRAHRSIHLARTVPGEGRDGRDHPARYVRGGDGHTESDRVHSPHRYERKVVRPLTIPWHCTGNRIAMLDLSPKVVR